MAYIYKVRGERMFFPSTDLGYPVSQQEERNIRTGIAVLLVATFMAFALCTYLIVRGVFESFPPIPDGTLSLGPQRWRYLGLFIGAWVPTWIASLIFWGYMRRLIKGRKGTAIHNLKLGSRLSYSLLAFIRPAGTLFWAFFLTALMFQSFGDVCFVYRGVGSCEIVKIDLDAVRD